MLKPYTKYFILNDFGDYKGRYIEMANLADEILKTIKYAIDRKTINCDRTYRTVIKRIDKNGYVITDETGQERTVPCGIPNVELRPM